MKVYQREAKPEGDYTITQATQEKVISQNNVLFWFPGVLVTGRKTHYLKENLGYLEGALEDKSGAANIFAVAYNRARDNERSLKNTNADVNYSNEEAQAFVEQYLLPMIHDQKQITLVGYSYGASFIEMTRRVLVKKLRDSLFSDEDINKMLQNVMVINISGVSTEQPGTMAEPNFTTVRFDSQQDTIGSTLNAAVGKYQQLLHGKGLSDEIVVRPISTNRVQVSIPIKPEGAIAPRYNKESRKTELLPHDPEKHGVPGHKLVYYVHPNDATYPGGVEMVRKTLQYAVSRQGPPVDMLPYLTNLMRRCVPDERTWTVYVRNSSSANRIR
ncbi:MAG TPA: hypothetical protein VFT64_02325 [Rickettsiales bacterium]|nr:hypothetical protein [Rickettsiales bacterium]